MGFNKAIFVILGVLLLGSGLVMALPQNATTVNDAFLNRWSPSGTADSVTTEGGNISWANASGSDQLTDRWAGFFGNVTASNIILKAGGDGSSTYLYQWAGSLTTGGEVCVSTNTNFPWASVVEGTDANIETAWSFGSVIDSAALTYSQANCALVFTGIAAASTDQADYVDHHNSTFNTCVFSDGSVAVPDDLAFCVAINQTGQNYQGTPANYEMIVPANDSAGATETYYFYIELG